MFGSLLIYAITSVHIGSEPVIAWGTGGIGEPRTTKFVGTMMLGIAFEGIKISGAFVAGHNEGVCVIV